MRTHRSLSTVALLALSCTLMGCIGAVVGTALDRAQDALSYPVKEYAFFGVYKHANDANAPWQPLEDDRERDYGHELVGIAVSGGGSRAAYFLACVLDELRTIPVEPNQTTATGGGQRTLLDEVDYLSGVSGGALAATYYALHRPATSDPAALDTFFARYRADMRRNFELRSVGRTLFMLRWLPLALTYYHRGNVMASTWDANFFDDATFADLPTPGPDTPHPTLIVNATSYSSGQKFLFTRVPTTRFNSSALFARARGARLITEGHDRDYQPLENTGFDTIDSDLGRFPLSMAVVASAGVPNLLGPVVLQDRTSAVPAYEALGDGGIYDNYGLETLMQLFATILEEHPGMKARIIVIDGSGYFRTDHERLAYTVAGYADRTTGIGWLRSAGYAEPFFRAHSATTEDEDATDPYRNLSFDVLSLYHVTEATTEDEPVTQSLIPRALGTVYGGVENTVQFGVGTVTRFITDLNEHAKGIGTRFKLSNDDANTVEEQARLDVAQVLGDGPAPANPELDEPARIVDVVPETGTTPAHSTAPTSTGVADDPPVR